MLSTTRYRYRIGYCTRFICTTPHNPILESISFKHPYKNWQDQRKHKLTASTFAQAVGFWPNRRLLLWLEKIGAVEPFTGNLATCWNNIKEHEALERYKLITGNPVTLSEFHVNMNSSQDHSWLGASPDGIINRKLYALPYRGILEIKCPFYKGDMRKGFPWTGVPYNYVPQAQGLMEILNRDWMDFYVWTPKGSSIIRIDRDLEYWKLLEVALSEFWLDHVQPAREIYCKYEVTDPVTELKMFCPKPKHELCDHIVKESRRVAGKSRLLMREFFGKLRDY